MQKKKLLLSIFADKALRLEYFSCFKQIEVQLKLSTGSWRVFPIKWRNLLRSLNLKLSNHLSCGEGSLWQTTLIGYYLCGDLSLVVFKWRLSMEVLHFFQKFQNQNSLIIRLN